MKKHNCRLEAWSLRLGAWGLITCAVLVFGLPRQGAAQTDYRIGPQDVLTITVFGETDLSGHFTVEQDGTFTFPLVGRVTAGGATLRALEQDLKKALADGFLKNPQVTVAIETYRSKRILIMGEVRSPGEYQLTSDMSLMAALARAGSTTSSAGTEALIIRTPRRTAASPDPAEGADPEILRINLGELRAGNVSLNVMLQDGDTVNVLKALSVFVTGQVKAPGAYSIEPGMTVLQALSIAGGVTDRGASGRVKILRTVDGKSKEMKVKLIDPVEPGDTIVVPERFF